MTSGFEPGVINSLLLTHRWERKLFAVEYLYPISIAFEAEKEKLARKTQKVINPETVG